MGSEVIEAELKELREKLRDYGNSVEEMARHCFYAGKNLEAGDISTKRIIRDLATHCSAARLKYQEGHGNTMTTRGVLAGELYELDDAMHRRASREVRAELLDIATTCIRGVEAMDRVAAAAEPVPCPDCPCVECGFHHVNSTEHLGVTRPAEPPLQYHQD